MTSQTRTPKAPSIPFLNLLAYNLVAARRPSSKQGNLGCPSNVSHWSRTSCFKLNFKVRSLTEVALELLQ